jgi:ABC-type dipeptide/oligopeptide/nickel transport system permease component
MPKIALTHFEATILLAFLISVVLGVVSRTTDRERLRYGLRCFAYFLLTVLGLGWLMYLGHR